MQESLTVILSTKQAIIRPTVDSLTLCLSTLQGKHTLLCIANILCNIIFAALEEKGKITSRTHRVSELHFYKYGDLIKGVHKSCAPGCPRIWLCMLAPNTGRSSVRKLLMWIFWRLEVLLLLGDRVDVLRRDWFVQIVFNTRPELRVDGAVWLLQVT